MVHRKRLPREGRTPAGLVDDSARILRAMNRAFREALLRHKRLGTAVATWRDGRVVWIPPEEIRVEEE